MQSEDYAEKRKRIDRWFEIHGHLECEDCNPRPVNKRKLAKAGGVKPDSGNKGSAGGAASKPANSTSKTKGTARQGNEPSIGSESEELAEESAAKQRQARRVSSGAKAPASRRRAGDKQGK